MADTTRSDGSGDSRPAYRRGRAYDRGVQLPVMPPVKPMLAKAIGTVPREPGLCYEPKWDGFRCVVFRDRDELVLGSRNDRPLTRYFPDVVERLKRVLPDRCVVDGELVLVTAEGLDFDGLQNRLHPAASRVTKLAAETPASFVAFDLLALGATTLVDTPFTDRRRRLEDTDAWASDRVHLTPLTTDPNVADDWFVRFEGAGFDGVMAKAGDLPYRQNKRMMLKIKHERTADCVVGGFRMHADGRGVGSLLLGLYDEHSALHHVGVAAGFTASRREQLLDELASLRDGAGTDHPWLLPGDTPDAAAARLPGGLSRWSAGKDLSWYPLRPELVAEIRYEHLQSGRLRHGGRLVGFRPDRTPESCTYAQLEEAAPAELAGFFAEARAAAPSSGQS